MPRETPATYRITDLSTSDRPRERLASLGPQALSNAELIAILLRVGVRGESAVAVEFYNPDLFHNLARVHLRMGRRDRAYPVLLRGLQLHPEHQAILGDLRALGVRRRPFLPFLSRGNPVNRFFGMMFRETARVPLQA